MATALITDRHVSSRSEPHHASHDLWENLFAVLPKKEPWGRRRRALLYLREHGRIAQRQKNALDFFAADVISVNALARSNHINLRLMTGPKNSIVVKEHSW